MSKTVSDPKPQKSGGKRAALRAAARARRKVYYALGQARNEINRKRRMQKHLRANPHDAQAKTRYEKDMGRADSFGLSSRGRKLIRRAQPRRAA